MNRRILTWPLGVVFVCNAACKDDYRCRRTNLDGLYEDAGQDQVCLSASILAARDTEGLVPSQAEVDRYFERMSRAVDVEPLVIRGGPQAYRAPQPAFAYLYTTNSAAIGAWRDVDSAPAPETGDAALDAIVTELEPTIWYGSTTWNDEFYFEMGMNGVFNEEVLDERLRAMSSRLEEPADRASLPDTTWTWNEAPTGSATATATLMVRLGWGDCFSGCRYFRELRAVVPPHGAATVFDLGGDPLPPGLELQPTTRPPP